MTDSLADIAPVNRRYAEEPGGLTARVGRWFFRLAGQVRRQYLCRLRPGYVARARRRRRGDCRQCGSCCHLTFRCPFWRADGLCNIYDRRTRTCRDFPVDARDLRLTRVPCGYWFETEPEDADGADTAG
ncbi:MAG: hypothetical protein R6X20_07855 [Phycisphaerae bacterium]